MLDVDRIKTALCAALANLGVSEYEIYYTASSGISVDTLDRAVSAFSSSDSNGVCLRVIIDGRVGYASSELIEEHEMAELAYRACENARSVEKVDTVGIYGGSDSYEEQRTPEHKSIGAAELRALALELGERTYAADSRVKSGTTTQATSFDREIGIINSHGVDLHAAFGMDVIAAEAVVAEGEEQQSDFAYCAYIGDGQQLDAVAGEAVGNATSKLGASDNVPSGRYDIIIDGKQMRELLAVYSGAFSAKNVLDGMSSLRGKLGCEVASKLISLTDDPQRQGNMVGIPFDAEGVATHRRAVIEGGVLRTFLHNRETALAMGCETTANASKADYSSAVSVRPYSFCIEAGDDSMEQLMAKVGDGILITELKGLHAGANTVSGDFSLESEGFMIRGGKRAEAIKCFTVAGNFFELLRSITAVGDRIETGVQMGITGFGSPAVLVPDMPVAGK